MAGGYEHAQDGTDGVAALLKDKQQQIDALRSGARIKSSVLRGDNLTFQDAAGNLVAQFGVTQLSLFANGEVTGSDNFLGSVYFTPGESGAPLFLAASYESTGETTVQAGSVSDYTELDQYRVFANDVAINGNDVDIVSVNDVDVTCKNGRALLGAAGGDTRSVTSTTGSAANVYKDPATSRFYRSTSALKYKTDIADAEVDPADVLSLAGRTWVDKDKIDNPDQPEHLRRDVGFIADELDALPSLRQFVVYDEDGEPDSIEYDRLSVALLVLAKVQQARLDSFEERLSALEGG